MRLSVASILPRGPPFRVERVGLNVVVNPTVVPRHGKLDRILAPYLQLLYLIKDKN